MEKIVGIRFKKTGKMYYVDSLNHTLNIGDMVVSESERGLELARVVSIQDKKEFLEKNKDVELKKLERVATKEDLQKDKDNKINAEKALEKCKKLAKKLNLNMKLIHAEYTLDATKLIFYFVAEDRVDFRELVKNLASEYKVRIEIRQVGPRDEIKSYPNVGMCGKEVCCATFLPDFESVTIKMAKEQGLQINMGKLSGNCGRLKCCLKYEEDVYKEKMKDLPKVNEIVTYKEEPAKVVSLEILKGRVKLKIGPQGEEHFEVVDVSEIKRKVNSKGGE